MNKNTKTETTSDRPVLRTLFVEELGTVQGGRDRSPTTRSNFPGEHGGGSSKE